MDMQGVETRMREMVEPILAKDGVELVELTLGRHGAQYLLRLLVDKPGGITLGECSRLNERISEHVDRLGALQERYTLEVSSPGIDRPLATKHDFLRHLEEEIELLYHDEGGCQRQERVMIRDVWEQFLIVERTPGERFNVSLDRIVTAKLVIRL